MAIYSGTATSVSISTDEPVLEFVSAGEGVRARLIELSTNQSGGSNQLFVIRPAAAGLAAPGGTTYLEVEDDEPPSPYFVWSPVTITSLWSRKPSEEWTVTANGKMRRTVVANTSFCQCWTFPRGLIIAPGYSILIGTSSTSGTVTASCVVEV